MVLCATYITAFRSSTALLNIGGSSSSSSRYFGVLKGIRQKPPITADSTWTVQPIGRIEVAAYQRKFGVPKQATIGNSASPRQEAYIHLYPQFKEALQGLREFDYIWVLSMLHLNVGHKLTIVPKPSTVTNPMQPPPSAVGLFTTRAPHRPNPIGLSALRITHVDENNGVISVLGIDLLDGTPVLDIKPYVAAFDSFPDASAGWMDSIRSAEDARVNGYQTITSKRGARAERARLRAIAREREGEKAADYKDDEESTDFRTE